MKVLFLIPYPLGEAPSQRFRFEQYLPLLKENNFQTEIQSFITHKARKKIDGKQDIILTFWIVITGMMKRILILFKVPGYDYVYLHREAAPMGPPVMEWIISRVLRRKIIYDFDDAIWLTDKEKESGLEKIIRWRSKTSSICKWSHRISCGNGYLADYARTFNPSVVLNPTTIDAQLHDPVRFPKKENQSDKQVTIGWTGSHSTLKYIYEIVPVMKSLESKFPELKFLIIANQKPAITLASMEFIPWNREKEIEDLLKIDIGLMPLPEDEWTKGKCGLKALQYMALEIPTVASPVGVNSAIINHKVDGFLCSTPEEWLATLENLVRNPQLRKEIGRKARQKVVEGYSVRSNSSTFLSLFQK